MLKQTKHRVYCTDARDIPIADESVELVVTSPPYPMIEMWDEVFEELTGGVNEALESEDGDRAFELMHNTLRAVWEELERVVSDGGIVCVNIGDATRSVGGDFQVYRNASRITELMQDIGFTPLPHIYWKKPTTSPNSFLGSGTLPPNAYVTMEHEYILIFRKGKTRSFDSKDQRRYESSIFFDERNKWFNDHWTELPGRDQSFKEYSESTDQDTYNGSQENRRERTAAYPLSVPYRLINMFSLYDDTVLDPFAGVGTTTLAAMVSGRNSISIELNENVIKGLEIESEETPKIAQEIIQERITRQQEMAEERRKKGNEPGYEMENYPVKVVSKQEQKIKFYEPSNVSLIHGWGKADHTSRKKDGESRCEIVVTYEPYNQEIGTRLSHFQ